MLPKKNKHYQSRKGYRYQLLTTQGHSPVSSIVPRTEKFQLYIFVYLKLIHKVGSVGG